MLLDDSPVHSNRAPPRNQKRVGLGASELQNSLFALFQKKEEYKLTDLVDELNHPVNPLKTALKLICKYDNRKKVFMLKNEYKI